MANPVSLVAEAIAGGAGAKAAGVATAAAGAAASTVTNAATSAAAAGGANSTRQILSFWGITPRTTFHHRSTQT